MTEPKVGDIVQVLCSNSIDVCYDDIYGEVKSVTPWRGGKRFVVTIYYGWQRDLVFTGSYHASSLLVISGIKCRLGHDPLCDNIHLTQELPV